MEKVVNNKGEGFLIAKKVLTEKGLNPDILGIAGLDLPVEEYTIALVIEALKKLSPVKAMLQDDDLLELKGYEFDGTVQVVDEVHKLLDAAVTLHASTH